MPTALIVFAGLASADETLARCKQFGLIFSIDPLGDTLLLKDASDISSCQTGPRNTHLQTAGCLRRRHHADPSGRLEHW